MHKGHNRTRHHGVLLLVPEGTALHLPCLAEGRSPRPGIHRQAREIARSSSLPHPLSPFSLHTHQHHPFPWSIIVPRGSSTCGPPDCPPGRPPPLLTPPNRLLRPANTGAGRGDPILQGGIPQHCSCHGALQSGLTGCRGETHLRCCSCAQMPSNAAGPAAMWHTWCPINGVECARGWLAGPATTRTGGSDTGAEGKARQSTLRTYPPSGTPFAPPGPCEAQCPLGFAAGPALLAGGWFWCQ